MHISPTVGMDPDRIPSVPPRMGPITSSISPATQSDILEILQREQDHAMALLSLSPLLSSLFISYANRAAALELASSTPSPESEGGKALQATIAALREEIEKFKSENLEVTGKLEVAAASRETFRSQVSSLKEANTTQQDDIKSLRTELVETKEKYNRFVVNSNAEITALQIRVFDLEARREELKETVVEQQIKILKFERQDFNGHPNLPEAADTRKHNNPKDRNTVGISTRIGTSRLEDERLTDAAQGSPLIKPAPRALSSKPAPEVVLNTGLEFPKQSKEAKDEVPAIPQPQPTLSLHKSDVPSITGPEEPNPLRERKKPKMTPAVPTSSSFGGGGRRNFPNVLGDAGNDEPTVATTAGDCQSAPTETAYQKRENQRKDIVDEPLYSSSSRRKDSTRSNVTTKPTPARAFPQRSSGWGSWGSSLLASIADQPLASEKSPPESLPFKESLEYRFVWDGKVGSRPDPSWRPATTG